MPYSIDLSCFTMLFVVFITLCDVDLSFMLVLCGYVYKKIFNFFAIIKNNQ